MRINIGKQFSLVPSGRVPEDGPDSGERFRQEFLIPALQKGGTVEIEIDDAVGYQSSFLEEAFGLLSSETGIPVEELRQRIVVISSDPEYEIYRELIEFFLLSEGRSNGTKR